MVKFFTPMPSDQAMERRFTLHRAAFDQLIGMSDEDPTVGYISYSSTWQNKEREATFEGKYALSQERWNEYKKLFGSLGLQGGLSRSESGNLILLMAYMYGIVPAGIEKGYMFSREPRDCASASLDDPKSLGNQKFACKHLDGQWYLYLSQN